MLIYAECWLGEGKVLFVGEIRIAVFYISIQVINTLPDVSVSWEPTIA